MRATWLAAIAGVIIPAMAAATAAWAGDPLEYTKSVLEQARAIASSDRTQSDKVTALYNVFEKFLDTDSMAKEALGPRWPSFTPDQQREFLPLFRTLMERNYVARMLLFEKPNFTYVGTERQDSQTQVKTQIVTPRDEFEVDYLLRPDGDRWVATRITVEDVSLTSNLGSQLDHLLSRSSPQDVIDLLKKKYGNAGGSASAS